VKVVRPARVLWLASLAGTTQAQTAPAPPASAAALAPLLNQVMARVGTAPHESAEPGLFQRLAGQQLKAQRTQAGATPASAPAKPANPTKTAARKTAPRKASASAPAPIVPALAWAMEQLDPGSFAVLRPVPVGGSGALLRTGDVFVVQFSTSLPGHVRLENVDPKGQTADLGTYTVLVDQLNRLPRDKGIQLQGQPGVERLRFYFYPCLPTEAANKAWLAEFKGRLPACPAESAVPMAQAGRPDTLGTVAPRALVNLAQTDAHVAIAGSTDYQPGDVTLMEALIRHESRGHAR
jgi:hypothetical protein